MKTVELNLHSPESIGQILNTNPQNLFQEQSKSDEYSCDCGTKLEPIAFRWFTYWPKMCQVCEGKEKKLRQLEQRRTERKQYAQSMHKAIEKILPPRYRNAHLRTLSPKLREIMLALPHDKGLMLFGSTGVGKSHSMCALMRYYRITNKSVIRTSYDNLCLEIRDSYKNNISESEIIGKYQKVDKLLIEDVGTTVGTTNQESDFSLRIFLMILDYRIEYCKPVFITSNKTIDQLASSFDDRVASRIQQGCEIIAVRGYDKRLKRS
jgi:DNA replication protein DnaC